MEEKDVQWEVAAREHSVRRSLLDESSKSIDQTIIIQKSSLLCASFWPSEISYYIPIFQFVGCECRWKQILRAQWANVIEKWTNFKQFSS